MKREMNRKRKVNFFLVVLLMASFLAWYAPATSQNPHVVKETVVAKQATTAKDLKVAEKKGLYKVVSPLGRSTTKKGVISPRLPDLKGKKIGFVWVGFVNGDILIDALENLLFKRFEGLKFVKLPSGKTQSWGAHPIDETLGALAKENKVDAVIVSVGG